MPTTTKHEARLVPVSRLKPYGKNPRRGDVETIRESLRENGQYRHYKHETVLLGDRNGGPPIEPDPADLDDQCPVLYGYTAHDGRRGRGSEGWWGNNRQTSVLAVDRPTRSRDHPTMKPLRLIEIALRNSSRRGHLVLDPFAGSGSTMMACEPLGRHARLMEVDPRYCDVIVKRWEQHTGHKAERLD